MKTLFITAMLACAFLTSSAAAEKAAPEDFADYFPVQLGTQWVYDIQFPTPDIVPLTNNSSTRDICSILTKAPGPDGKSLLIISVIESQEKKAQGLELFELDVKRDDLHLYSDSNKLYYEVRADAPYKASERQGFSLLGLSPGLRVRRLVCQQDEGKAYWDNNELFIFIGREVLDGIPALHFKRVIVDDKPGGKEFIERYEEDAWYGKNVGLMKSVQTIDDKTSMVLTLQQRPHDAVISISTN